MRVWATLQVMAIFDPLTPRLRRTYMHANEIRIHKAGMRLKDRRRSCNMLLALRSWHDNGTETSEAIRVTVKFMCHREGRGGDSSMRLAAQGPD